MLTKATRIIIPFLFCLTLLFGVVSCGTSEEESNGDNGNNNKPSSTDIFGPTVSNVAVSGISLNGATVTCATDEPATSQVRYGLTSDFGSVTILDSALVINHTVTMTGLTSGDFYYVQPYSKDASGNESFCMYENFYTSMQQNLAIGTSAKNSQQQVTMRSAIKTSSYDWGSGYAEHAASGYVFLIVDVLVENIGSKDFYATNGDTSLADVDGFRHEWKIYMADDDFNSVQLFPGQKTQGKILFEIPETATGLKLAYDFGVLEACVATWVV